MLWPAIAQLIRLSVHKRLMSASNSIFSFFSSERAQRHTNKQSEMHARINQPLREQRGRMRIGGIMINMEPLVSPSQQLEPATVQRRL